MPSKTGRIQARLSDGDILHRMNDGSYFWHGYSRKPGTPYREWVDFLIERGEAVKVPADDGCEFHVVAKKQEQGT